MLKNRDLFGSTPPYLRELFDTVIYPWELISKLDLYIKHLLECGIEGFHEYSPGVLIGESVEIPSGVTVISPAIIGHHTELRPGAYLRGRVITGERCVIGNSCEVKNSIMLDGVQIPHYNYVGDSILGNMSHMGAGAICSNLKNDGSSVVIRADEEYTTGMRKLGAILGDRANVGCGCVLNPGTVIGRDSSVYPLTSVRGVIPPDSIVKSGGNTVKKEKGFL